MKNNISEAKSDFFSKHFGKNNKDKKLVFLFFLLFFIFLFHCKPPASKSPDKKDNPSKKSWTISFNLQIETGKSESQKFILDEGTKFSKKELDSLQKKLLNKHAKEGYSFDGWYENDKFTGDKITTEGLKEVTVTADKTFYGKLDVLTYTVSFNTDGGSAIESVTVNHGEKLTKPNDPTKTGLVFQGWYKEESHDNLFDFSTETITGDVTLYALFLSDTPSNILLSANTVDEAKAIGTVIGNLTTTDGTKNDAHTYTLVAGDGDTDNASFTIDGDNLKSAKIFDYEVKNSYSIRLRTTDKTSKTFDKKFTITINDLTESISYAYNDVDKYVEATANDGSIDGTKFITVTVQNLTFKGNVNDKLTLNTDFTVANVPAGLTIAVTKSSDTTAKITFEGRATAHSLPVDNKNNVSITFANSAFLGSPNITALATKTKNDINVEFTLYTLTYAFNTGDKYEEAAANDGSIDTTKFITVTANNGLTFKGNNGDTLTKDIDFSQTINEKPVKVEDFALGNKQYTFSDGSTIQKTGAAPTKDINYAVAGLTPVVTRLSATTAKITFTGNANSHNGHNITGIIFKNSAFTGSPNISGIVGQSKNDIRIQYVLPVFKYSFVNEIYDNSAHSYKLFEKVSFNSIPVRSGRDTLVGLFIEVENASFVNTVMTKTEYITHVVPSNFPNNDPEVANNFTSFGLHNRCRFVVDGEIQNPKKGFIISIQRPPTTISDNPFGSLSIKSSILSDSSIDLTDVPTAVTNKLFTKVTDQFFLANLESGGYSYKSIPAYLRYNGSFATGITDNTTLTDGTHYSIISRTLEGAFTVTLTISDASSGLIKCDFSYTGNKPTSPGRNTFRNIKIEFKDALFSLSDGQSVVGKTHYILFSYGY